MCTTCRLEIDIGAKFKILIGKHVDSTKGYEAMQNTHIHRYIHRYVPMYVQTYVCLFQYKGVTKQ